MNGALLAGLRRFRRSMVAVPCAAILVAGVMLGAGVGAGEAAATVTTSSPQTQLSSLADSYVASVVAPNGDRNPYGVAVVPVTAGALTKGNLLIAEFNNAAGVAGAGTSIVQVDPATGATSAFYSGPPVAGPVGIAINPVNDGVWVGNYGSASNGTAANDILISAAGTLVATFTNSTTSGMASFVGVWGQAVSQANGAVSFYWGNAGNASTGTGGGDVWRLTPHPTGTANGQPVNSTYAQITTGQAETPAGGNAASAGGPQGMAYDAASGVLYETNDASNTLYAIANAASVTAPAPATIVYHGPALASPENVVIDPLNGNLLVVNGGNNNLVEITPAGQVVATRDLAPGQPAGALFGLAIGTDANANPVIYYVNDNQNTLRELSVPSTSSFAITRLAGADRFATAADIATATFPNGAATVVVASGLATDLSDSLAASYLAAQENGGAGAPILLVNSTRVPAATMSAIATLKATAVVIIGGSGAVSDSVAATFTAAHLAVSRVAGTNRFGTTDAIDSQAGMTKVGTVGGNRWAIVASGVDANLVDALGASPVSYAKNFPLLLVNGPSAVLSSADLSVLSTDAINDVLIVGGTASVGSQVDSQLTALHYNPVTQAGSNRSATSQTLADYAITNFGFSTSHFNVASGDQGHIVDSLAGGPHGGVEMAPTLITDSVDNAGSVVSFAAEHTATEASAHLFGGSDAVDATVEAAIAAAA